MEKAVGFLVLLGANRIASGAVRDFPPGPCSFLVLSRGSSASIMSTQPSWKHALHMQPLRRMPCHLKAIFDSRNWRRSQEPPWRSTWHVEIETRKSQAPEGSWISKAGWIPLPSSPETCRLGHLRSWRFHLFPKGASLSNDMNRWRLTKALLSDPFHIVENSWVIIYFSPLWRFCRKRDSLWLHSRDHLGGEN